MSDEQKKIVPIDYTHREFQSIREDLIGIAERFYPDTFQDFSEGSFGSMMVDAVAYVGDQLSFYLDYNVNEAFLDTAYQYNNIVRHGRIMGYKDPGLASTYGQVALFAQVPASTTAVGPDSAYLPIIKKGSRFTATSGLNFVLTENVDMADPKNLVVVSQVNPTTQSPTYYAVKTHGNVVSGHFGAQQIQVGTYQRFLRIPLRSPSIVEVISVVDSEGNEYFEVDYLSQDMVFKEIPNNNFKNDNVPSVLKPYLVSRKFVVERSRAGITLQFGSGNTIETGGDAAGPVPAEPSRVALNIFGKDYVTDTSFDPTRLSKNTINGIVPANTKLSITYRVDNSGNSNAAVGALNSVSSVSIDFKDRNLLTDSKMSLVQSSIEVNNEEPIIGSVTSPTTMDLKQRIYDTFPTQNRAVTQADYENITYRMPAKFGSVKRVSVQRDPNSMKRNLNMYIISEDRFGKLIKPNTAIKNNLKTWLNQYRMMSDTIDILDAYIVNFGINFIVVPKTGVSRFDLLDSCVRQLRQKFANSYFIGEHLYISELYSELNKVDGVLDVVKVKVINKSSGNYSNTSFNINQNTSPDGTYIIAPKNAVFELKFPSTDITGKIK